MNPDISLSANVWHDLYEAAAISAGTAILVYNKGISQIMVWDGAAPPEDDSGVPVNADEPIVVEAGASGCWVKSMGSIRLSVQEYE